MRTMKHWFADVLHQREAQHDDPDAAQGRETDRRAVQPLPVHPIDGAALALMVGPRSAPRGGYEGIDGNLVLVAVSLRGAQPASEAQYEAGLLLRLPGLWEAAAAGMLAGDRFGGLFYQGGEDLLPLRVGWSMERPTGGMVACPPPLTTIRAEIHPLAQYEFALQFIGEDSASPQEGSPFAPPLSDTFASVESVTFGVPWLSPYQELVLTFPMAEYMNGVMRLVDSLRR